MKQDGTALVVLQGWFFIEEGSSVWNWKDILELALEEIKEKEDLNTLNNY